MQLPRPAHRTPGAPAGLVLLAALAPAPPVGPLPQAASAATGSVTTHVGCQPDLGSLTATGVPTVGQPFWLTMDKAQAPFALPWIAIAAAQLAPNPPCGLALPYGELQVDIFSTPPVYLPYPLWPGSPLTTQVDIPADPLLVGATAWVQGFFFDLDLTTTDPLRLTESLEVRIGS